MCVRKMSPCSDSGTAVKQNIKDKLGKMVYCNPGTQDDEAEESLKVQSQPGVLSQRLYQNLQTTNGAQKNKSISDC